MIHDVNTVYRWDGPPPIELRSGTAVLPSGLRYTAHWLVTGDGRSGVVVCALRGGDILLVQSTRPVVGRTMWELPRGFGEPDSMGPVDDGLRELREETGFRGSRAQIRGAYVTDTSVLPSAVSVVVCEVDPAQTPDATDGETDARRWVPLAHLGALIADGTLADAHTLAALATIAPLWAGTAGTTFASAQ